jgi:toxin CcdB
MAQQFEVFRTMSDMLVVVVQSDLLDAMRTRVVVPLVPAGMAGRPMRGLNPEIGFAEEAVVLMPQLAATLTIAELGRPVARSLTCGTRLPERWIRFCLAYDRRAGTRAKEYR